MRNAFSMLVLLACFGCKQEPVIVITFGPQDMTTTRDLARPPDLAPRVDAAARVPTAARVAECKTDGDCVVVSDGCCGCNAGGKVKAIARSARAAYERAQATRCQDQVCAEMISEDPSCKKVAACLRGKCELVAKK